MAKAWLPDEVIRWRSTPLGESSHIKGGRCVGSYWESGGGKFFASYHRVERFAGPFSNASDARAWVESNAVAEFQVKR
jgi:hypothetical protein